MLRLALFFLVVALTAALFGFSGAAVASAAIARIAFFIFLMLFAVALLAALLGQSSNTSS